MKSKRFSQQRGQVVVLVALSMTMLMGITALVVDLGFAYAAQRNLQSSADAAALAGAQGLPDLGNAVSYAEQYGTSGKNPHESLGDVEQSVTTTCVEGAGCVDDAVVVSETAHPSTFFARVLGVHLFTVSVKAVACRDPLTGKALLVSGSYAGPGCAPTPASNPDTGVTTPTTTDQTTTQQTTTAADTNPASTTPTTTEVTTTTPAATTTQQTTTTPGVAQPTLGTRLSTSPVTAGTTVNDTAALTGATSTAGGTVTYTVFSDSGCSQNAVTAGTKTVTDGVVPNSNSLTFNNAGTFYWEARYSGDAANKPALSPCTSEVLTVYGSCALGYPDTSHPPLSATTFNESDVLRAFAPNIAGPGATIKAWYNDEHALTLGIRQVVVKNSKTSSTTTNYPIAALPSNPGSATNPAVGASVAQGGVDVSNRPMFPALFVTDITGNPTSRAGDWQQGSTNAIPPNAVFGTWKGAVQTIDSTVSPAKYTVTPDADPSKNRWNLGPGSDAPPAGLTDEGYGAEARWNVDSLGLQPGHAYRMVFMVHDGDQNKSGGDSGEACMTVVMPS